MGPLLEIDATYPLAGLLFTVLGAGVTAFVAYWRGKNVEVPATQANAALSNAKAAREEASAATEMLQAQREFIRSVSDQLAEAQRQAKSAQEAATEASLSAEDAKQQLAKVKTEAAEREHELVNGRLRADARVAMLERTVEAQASRIVALEAQLGQIERRSA